jgi:hypothetical protein
MQQVKPHGQERLHTSVNVYPKNTQALAAVGAATFACRADPAAYVWVNRTTVTYSNAHLVSPSLDDFACQFMTQHARIGIGRVSASEGIEIAATDADSEYSKERFTARSLGGRNLPFK